MHASRIKTIITTFVIAIILAILASLLLILIYPSAGRAIQEHTVDRSNMARFEVTSGKSELEKAINGYIQQRIHIDGWTFNIAIDEQIEFNGDVDMLGQKVKLTVVFHPVLQPNGDLILEQKSFKAGGLRLPSSVVLEYIQRTYHFPDWIKLQPADKQIYLAATKFKTAGGVQFRVRVFDLVGDHLEYDVFVPGG